MTPPTETRAPRAAQRRRVLDEQLVASWLTVLVVGSMATAPSAAESQASPERVEAPGAREADETETETDEDEHEDDELTLGDVVVRGTSEADRLAQSSDAVHVVDTTAVRAQSQDMGEVLARQQGVSVRRSGGLGSDARICIHGICDAGIRYYLDGVPLELQGFGLGISNVPLSMVERIEIYRGAVPVRLGTDALGGVINLVRSTDHFRPHVSGSYQTGSWATYRASVEGGARDAGTGLYVGASAYVDHSDNDYLVDVDAPDATGRLRPVRVRRFHDAYTAYGVSGEAGLVGVPWADRLLVRAFVSEYDRELQNNIVMTVPYGGVTYGEVSAGTLVHYQHQIDALAAIDAFVGYTRRDITFDDTSTSVFDWFGRRVRTRRVAGEIDSDATLQHIWEDAAPARLTLTLDPSPEHQVVANVTSTFVRRSGDDLLITDPARRDPLSAQRDLFRSIVGLEHRLRVLDGAIENSLYAKDYIYFAATEEALSGNIFVRRERFTHDVGIGDGLRWRIVEGLFVRGTYEYAVRLPEADEVFGDGVLTHANLDLVPERSHNGTLELSADTRGDAGHWTGALAGFVRARENMIVLLGNDTFLTYQNVYRAVAIGAEGALSWTSPGDWALLSANATYLDDRNRSGEGAFAAFEGDRIPNRPYLFANLGAELRVHGVLSPHDRLSLGWRGRYVHEFFRAWESPGLRAYKEEIPAQFGQDLSLGYTLDTHPRVTFSFDVTNLADAPLFDTFGVQRPGRPAYARLTVAY